MITRPSWLASAGLIPLSLALAVLLMSGCSRGSTERESAATLRELVVRERQANAQLQRELASRQEQSGIERAVLLLFGGALGVCGWRMLRGPSS